MYGLLNRAVKGRGRMRFVEDDDEVRRAIVGLPAADGWAVDGREIACRVRESRPETPVVLVSGFDLQEAQDAIEGRTAMLLKPFTITELNAATIGLL
ncbi:MAG: hypothetical protein CMJ54_06690 [Planctomycetaceae bacterium]|nr:hypothetical protein [Planctomycetaceae bacterium]